jgi:hypothetical protein
MGDLARKGDARQIPSIVTEAPAPKINDPILTGR